MWYGGTLLVRYLGVPLISTKLTVGDYSPLINKITAKIKQKRELNLFFL